MLFTTIYLYINIYRIISYLRNIDSKDIKTVLLFLFLLAHLVAQDVNLIAVDWSAGSGMYSQGLANAVQCGERIASFINLLINIAAYGPENYRIVGIGLGAHIAGIAASFVSTGNIGHIVGKFMFLYILFS